MMKKLFFFFAVLLCCGYFVGASSGFCVSSGSDLNWYSTAAEYSAINHFDFNASNILLNNSVVFDGVYNVSVVSLNYSVNQSYEVIGAGSTFGAYFFIVLANNSFVKHCCWNSWYVCPYAGHLENGSQWVSVGVYNYVTPLFRSDVVSVLQQSIWWATDSAAVNSSCNNPQVTTVFSDTFSLDTFGWAPMQPSIYNVTSFSYGLNVFIDYWVLEINSLNVSNSVTLGDPIYFVLNVSSNSSVLNSSGCVLELFKGDLAVPLFNVSTNNKTGDLLSLSLDTSSLGSGVLEWRKVWCANTNGFSESNLSVNLNVTIDALPVPVVAGGGGGGGEATVVITCYNGLVWNGSLCVQNVSKSAVFNVSLIRQNCVKPYFWNGNGCVQNAISTGNVVVDKSEFVVNKAASSLLRFNVGFTDAGKAVLVKYSGAEILRNDLLIEVVQLSKVGSVYVFEKDFVSYPVGRYGVNLVFDNQSGRVDVVVSDHPLWLGSFLYDDGELSKSRVTAGIILAALVIIVILAFFTSAKKGKKR